MTQRRTRKPQNNAAPAILAAVRIPHKANFVMTGKAPAKFVGGFSIGGYPKMKIGEFCKQLNLEAQDAHQLLFQAFQFHFAGMFFFSSVAQRLFQKLKIHAQLHLPQG